MHKGVNKKLVRSANKHGVKYWFLLSCIAGVFG